MKIADKNLGYYWSIVKWPFVVYIVAGIVLSVLSYISPFFSLLILPVLILVIAYVGWITVKKKDGSIVNAAISGVFFGLIMGIISVILIIVSSFVVMSLLPPLPSYSDEIFSDSPAVDALSKINMLVSKVIFIFVMVGIFVLPPFYAIISAIIATIAGFIAKQTMKK